MLPDISAGQQRTAILTYAALALLIIRFMWANWEVGALAEWMRGFNKHRPKHARVGGSMALGQWEGRCTRGRR